MAVGIRRDLNILVKIKKSLIYAYIDMTITTIWDSTFDYMYLQTIFLVIWLFCGMTRAPTIGCSKK